MGFFSSGVKEKQTGLPSLDFLQRRGCKACSLDKAVLRSPKMLPTGSATPTILFLGEAPGQLEDFKGEQFVGPSGDLLRPLIPKQWRDKIRWQNALNCRPPKNRDPTTLELECCRPRIVSDIEQTKPKAIFTFGAVPMEWALPGGQGGISNWRGRRIPVKIGSHACWLFPTFHPSYLLRNRKYGGKKSDLEIAFEFDLKRAFAEIETLPPPVVHTAAMAPQGVLSVTGANNGDLATVVRFLEKASQAGRYSGLDYETQNLRPYLDDSRILTISVSLGDETLAFGYEHPEAGWGKDQLVEIKTAFTAYLLSNAKKCSHNLGFEQEWSAYFFGDGTIRNNAWEDSMSQAFTLDERKGKRVGGKPACLSLEFLTIEYFGFSLKSLSSLDTAKLWREPLANVLLYNGMDSKYHLLLFLEQAERLEREGLTPQYWMKLDQVSTCILTQLKGILVDPSVNKKLLSKYADQVAEIGQQIAQSPENIFFKNKTGRDLKPGSHPDMEVLLRDIIGTRLGQGKGRFSADEEILKQVNLPITNLIIDYRSAVKQRSTYCVPFSSVQDGGQVYSGGLLHCQLNTTLTVTGRLSCDSPNLQNIPKRNESEKEVRSQVIAPKGRVIAAFDYGQIEARVIAMASKDKVFCKALWEDYDIHKEWAERIAYAWPPVVGGKQALSDPKIMKAFRNDIKSKWSFALFFGAQFESVVSYFEIIPKETLRPLYDEFWETFTGVHDWQATLHEEYRDYGFVTYLTGHRRHAPISANQLINAPIQATACYIVMEAMRGVCQLNDWEIQPILQVHDDISMYLDENKIDEQAEIVLGELLKVRFPFITVPLTVEMSVGKNWADMHEMGVYNSYNWNGYPEKPKWM